MELVSVAWAHTLVAAGQDAAAHDDFESAQHSYSSGPRQLLSGGCGLLSTAPDYAKFMQAAATPSQHRHRGRHLSHAR